MEHQMELVGRTSASCFADQSQAGPHELLLKLLLKISLCRVRRTTAGAAAGVRRTDSKTLLHTESP